MNYQEKLQALQALCQHSLKMRAPNDWYVSCSLEIKRGPTLVSEYGNGKTPEEAIERHWEIYSKVSFPDTIVINGNKENRKEYLWYGYMWEEKT